MSKKKIIKKLEKVFIDDDAQFDKHNSDFKDNNYNWDKMIIYKWSLDRKETRSVAKNLWDDIYDGQVTGLDDSEEYDESEEIIQEGLFSNNIEIEKIDDKHYKITGLFNKQFIEDINKYIDKGERLVKMFEIVTKRKLLFFKSTFVIIHTFYMPELYSICLILYKKSKKGKYRTYAEDIYQKTWLSEHNPIFDTKLNLSRLDDLKYTPKSYQMEFIKEYPKQKQKLQMFGSILALDQGLGKTFTSLALMHVLEKDVVFIFCPKTLLTNWSEEIKSVFKRKIKKSEIYITYYNEKITKDTKYVIVNYERINEALNIYKQYFNGKNIGLIVDECHNFKNIDAQRSKNLINFTDTSRPKDVLLLSGTPIKSNYYEFATYLRVLDPKFDDEALKIFKEIFKTNQAVASKIIKYRFEMIAYRKMKTDVLKLPPKIIKDIPVKIKDEERYYISTVKQEIQEQFEKLLKEEQKNIDKYMKAIFKILDKAESLCPDIKQIIESYKKLIQKSKDGYLVELLPKDQAKLIYEYEDKIEKCLKKHDKKDLKLFRELKVRVRSISLSVFGRVVGKILSSRRTEMIIRIFYENSKLVCKMINDSSKTIIFTYSKAAVFKIRDIIESKCGVKCVVMTGEDKDRESIIDKFKNDDSIKVFVTTYQVASTGLTLTVADTMIYADKPFRSEDLNQAHDRIYRIGQDKPVKIYYLKLKTSEPNIQDRVDEILEYYKEITGKVITYDDIEKQGSFFSRIFKH